MLGYSPKWQYVVSDEEDAAATSRTVTIFLKNFPRPGCKVSPSLFSSVPGLQGTGPSPSCATLLDTTSTPSPYTLNPEP